MVVDGIVEALEVDHRPGLIAFRGVIEDDVENDFHVSSMDFRDETTSSDAAPPRSFVEA